MRISAFILNVTVVGTLFINLPSLAAPQQQGPPRAPIKRILALREHGVSVELPQGWSAHPYANVHEILNVPPEKLLTLEPGERENVASANVTVIRSKDHAGAVRRLREIAAESNVASSFLTVGGWPALERREVVAKPTRGEEIPSAGNDPSAKLTIVTIAVAADALLFRFSGYVPQDATGQKVEQLEAMGRGMSFRRPGVSAVSEREVKELSASPPLKTPIAPPPGSSSSKTAGTGNADSPAISPDGPTDPLRPDAGSAGVPLNLQIGSEPEVAVSTNGNSVVVAQQCSYQASANGGTSFAFGGGSPGRCTGGDSSLGFGTSGNFYWATIGSNTATCPAASPNCNNTQEIARSANNGQTFAFVTNVIDCRATAGCGFGNVPDQEHIAADRFNASGSGGDQVYLVFRTGFGYGIQCSTDSGANWTAVAFHAGGSIDFPRITVAQDGTVYVITNNGNNVNLDSYSSCAAGLVQNLNQVNIATINQVPCPVPGLDRCNSGNVLSSHTLAVDDRNANHLYAAYATNTGSGNENILVQDSTNGGANWRAAVQVNAAVTGRRYMPWVCSVEGKSYVSWFDGRSATAGANDLTDYYGGSASLDGAGNLVAGADFRINGASDPECASGWPCVPRATTDSESCSTQPQVAGVCCNTANSNCPSNCPGPSCPAGSGQRCDFSAGGCPTPGDTCNPDPRGGCPKYGDYNGNACQFGRVYTVWPSATNQPGATGTGGAINLFFSQLLVHPPPVATCKNVTVSAGPTCTATASIDNGSSDPDGDPITLSQNPPGPYPLGDTLVTLTVTDSFRAQATCTGTVTVVDTTPPVVTCPAGTTASADATCHAPVPNVLAGVTITDNCPGPFTQSQTPAAGTTETLGVTPIVVNVQDASGNPASCATTFTIIDTTPPVVVSSVTIATLWPPNHYLRNVGLAASATDNCTANPIIAVTGIFSTEPDQGPDADFNFSPDARDIGIATLRLRSERPGGGQRVYLDVVQATDASGNIGYRCTTVDVPQDRSAAQLASVQAAAAAASSYCNAHNGGVPVGYVPVGIGPILGPKQ